MQDQVQIADPLPSVVSATPETVSRERAEMVRYSRFQFIHWFVLLASVVLTLIVWLYARAQEQQNIQARFEYEASHITDHIEERLQKYELALWGGVSAIKQNGDQMSRAGWKEFADNLEIAARYPGINGIGVIQEFEPEELEAHLAYERQTMPAYRIHPKHDQNIYRPITYIEPIDINAEAVGLDMVHEENRNTALLKARDTGTAQITRPIVLVQDQDKTPGFLFYAPYYAGHNATTLESRQGSFIGAVYAPFIVHKMVEGSLHQDRRSTAIRISDSGEVIYDEIDPNDPDYDANPVALETVELVVYGRIWRIELRTGQQFRDAFGLYKSNVILFFGGLIDCALLALFLMLTRAYQRGVNFAAIATSALDREAAALKQVNRELDVAREEAESLSQMKSNFLATMSHEVRTPLTAISGILVLLDRANPDKKNQKLIQAAQTSSDKLMKLLTGVLDISRLEADAVKLWERPVLIAPLIEEWQTIARGIIERLDREVEIKTALDADAPSHLMVDDIRLSQVMGNLIDNAARFTRAGTITIGLSHTPAQGAIPATVTFSVTDTGVGIPPEHQGAVFEQFRQVDGSITRENEGSGLGLAICKNLIKLMGGSITLFSTPGEGSRFEVTLPVK